MKFNEGDIYHWYFKKAPEFMPYHCCSNFAVVKNGLLYDTYWSYYSYENSKQWTKELAELNLELTYIGNFEDLVKIDEYKGIYYNEKDIVNLNHPNSSNGNFYIRKGAVKDKERMLFELQKEKDIASSRIATLKRDIDHIETSIKQINEGVSLDSIYIYIYNV